MQMNWEFVHVKQDPDFFDSFTMSAVTFFFLPKHYHFQYLTGFLYHRILALKQGRPQHYSYFFLFSVLFVGFTCWNSALSFIILLSYVCNIKMTWMKLILYHLMI